MYQQFFFYLAYEGLCIGKGICFLLKPDCSLIRKRVFLLSQDSDQCGGMMVPHCEEKLTFHSS